MNIAIFSTENKLSRSKYLLLVNIFVVNILSHKIRCAKNRFQALNLVKIAKASRDEAPTRGAYGAP